MPSTYTPIATQTVGSAVATVTFSSIPSTYTDLILIVCGTASSTSNNTMQFNGDTGANYSNTAIYADGTSAASTRNTSVNQMRFGGFESSVPGTNIIQIMNYANTTTYKTAIIRGNSTGANTFVRADVELWRSTAAINSIVYGPFSGNLNTGTTLTLYGIKAA